MLGGQRTVIAGSTRGIDPGIACDRDAPGAHLVLNGFGDAGQIESPRAGGAAVPVDGSGLAL